MDHKFTGALAALTLFFLGAETSSAAMISLDLDSNKPGIQSSRTLSPGTEIQFDIVYTGDTTTQFDTFVLDTVYHSSNSNSSIHLQVRWLARLPITRRSWPWSFTVPIL
jgi:phage protein D